MFEEPHYIPGNICLRCEKQLDGASGVRGGHPREGDLTICWYCALPMMFIHPEGEERLALRNVKREELLELLQNNTFLSVILAINVKRGIHND